MNSVRYTSRRQYCTSASATTVIPAWDALGPVPKFGDQKFALWFIRWLRRRMHRHELSDAEWARIDMVVDGNKTVVAKFSKLGFVWSQLAGPPANLSDSRSAKPSFTVAKGAVGVYGFQVTVTSDSGVSAQDHTSVRVFAVDISPDPPGGSSLSLGTEQTVKVTITYAALPVGSLLHVEFCAATGVTLDAARLIPTPQDFKLPAEAKPDSTFAGIYRFMVGDMCSLALVGTVNAEQGTVTSTLRLTPPILSTAYNMVFVSAYAFTAEPTNIFVGWSLADQPAPVFLVGP
jgi:hypothetical protein